MFGKIKALWMSWKNWKDIQKAIKEETMDGKKWYQSKTVWFNLLTGLVGIATTLSESPFASDPKVKAGFLTFVAIGNLVLRNITSQPIQ